MCDNRSSVRPTASQLAWADAEIGVIIHLDMQVFEPGYQFRDQWGYTPSPAIFNPRELNTDQWLDTAAAAGAKYAVLVAKHCSGFSLWPTKAHDYHIGSTPWRDGKGDIVADFFASCRKYDIKPGLYCSSSVNAFFNVDSPGRVRSGNPSDQQAYNRMVETQLTELWSNYGKIFEIWFDGGILPPEQGGPDLVPILMRLQPDAVVFQGPPAFPSLIRWPGNERAEAPYPCWSTTDFVTQSDGTFESSHPGMPNGSTWAPAEADMPNRDQNKAFEGGWFWRKNEENLLYPVEHLMDCYCRSVGRNTNLLLGMVIDDRGLVPDADVKQFSGFGRGHKRIFADLIAAVSGEGDEYLLTLPTDQSADVLVMQEDIRQGERVRSYIVEAYVDNRWIIICSGSCIGHKRIERVTIHGTNKLRLKITSSSGCPFIKDFSAWKSAFSV